MPPAVVLRPVKRPIAMCTGAVGLPHQSGKLTVTVSVVPSAKRSVIGPPPLPSAVAPKKCSLA